MAIDIVNNLRSIQQKIAVAEKQYGRTPNSVQLLAVSKTQPVEAIQLAYTAGQIAFGENYVQEAVAKIIALKAYPIEWHFIGALQSNKTEAVAKHFAWVHGVDRLKIAERLSQQRPPNLPPLNICLEVNIDNEPSKSGVPLQELSKLAHKVSALPDIRLRGLMAIPKPSPTFEQQIAIYQQIYAAEQQLIQEGLPLDTLSIGMTQDFEAAIAAGSTWVRIGTGIFGARH